MSLEQAANLSKVVGAIAVLASILFIGVQIRQNTQSQKVIAVNSLTAAIAAIIVPAMDSRALGEAVTHTCNPVAPNVRNERKAPIKRPQPEDASH